MLYELQKRCPDSIFDYGLLMDLLKDYQAPHRKVTALLASGDIIRVKKGLYVLGDKFRIHPLHRGAMANLIYGPSYVSCEYALGVYGLIPERVEVITSMTPKRNKLFITPVGQFSYRYLHVSRYTVGVELAAFSKDQHYLIASPEKALADTVSHYREIKTIKEMIEHLLENLRIDEDVLSNLDPIRLNKIVMAYNLPVVTTLMKSIKRIAKWTP